jgi:hypothetical protein
MDVTKIDVYKPQKSLIGRMAIDTQKLSVAIPV